MDEGADGKALSLERPPPRPPLGFMDSLVVPTADASLDLATHTQRLVFDLGLVVVPVHSTGLDLATHAESLGAAVAFGSGLLGVWSAPSSAMALVAGLSLVCLLLADFPCWRRDSELPISPAWPAWTRGGAYAVLILGISFVGEPNVRPFIYFQF